MAYTESVKQILYEEDLKKLWANCKYGYERLLLAVLWWSGARPGEIALIKRSDIYFGINEEDGSDFFEMKIKTLKLGRAQGFVVVERDLRSSRPLGLSANLYIETMIGWARKLQPDDLFVPNSSRSSINRTMHRLSKPLGHIWSAYLLRHSVFTLMARNNCSETDLMYWKGASDPASVRRYIHATPIYRRMENEMRSRDIMAGPRPEFKERYHASISTRPATKEEIKTLPMAEEEEKNDVEAST